MVWQQGHTLQNGKYIIESILGQGGFGITYKVWHEYLQAYVVIKTLNDELQDDPDYHKFEEKFQKEGRILQQLSQQKNHHIVRITDLFQEDNIWYLVMDFVEGESLQNLVQRRALSETEAVNYIRQIGKALIVVHSVNLVHRDAHPGNIMIQKDGTAILIDFGIAGEIIPTSRYRSSKQFAHQVFAPYEQCLGVRDARLDVYTLAASLYYAVTRTLPAGGIERYNEVYQKHPDPLISPKAYNSHISNDVEFAIKKGMNIERKYRSESMSKWLELLPDVDNKEDVEIEVEEETEEENEGESLTDEIEEVIDNEPDIIIKLEVIFNYLSQGLKVTSSITIDILKRIVNILGDILLIILGTVLIVFEVLGNILAAVSKLPLLELGYITFYYSVLGFSLGGIDIAIAFAIAFASGIFYIRGYYITNNSDKSAFALFHVIPYSVIYGIAYFYAIAYAIMGAFVFAESNIYTIQVVIVGAFAISYVIAGAVSRASAVAIASANAYCLYLTVMRGLKFGWLGVVGGIVLWILCILFLFTYFSAKDKLEKQSFSVWKRFLIYAGTSSLGLFLGWLVYQFFPISAHR